MPEVTIRYRIRLAMTISTDGAGPFTSLEHYRSSFEARLRRMLDEPTLGAFILVLANASFDPAMHARFRRGLAAAFARWCEASDAGEPESLGAAPDDRRVFERLRTFGFDDLGSTRWRQLGPWQLQFNPLRAFRPPRMSHAAVRVIRRPFDPNGFHFDKPFLKPEVLWEGRLSGLEARLLYNKFPFAELHGLLVPEPSAGRPQYLDRAVHDWVWRLADECAENLPGSGFGYNAYGAFSSVNHLHFQHYVRTDGVYPIEQPYWRHNGGMTDYPLHVEALADPETAWRHITQRQADNRPFNLIYRPHRVYIVDRAFQGSYRHSDWTGGFAWSEVAGAVTLYERAAFEGLTEGSLEAEFARMQTAAG